MNKKAHTSGLTFIEVLFILGIGCVLLVIMLPVYSQAKKKSRRTACIANLRQIGMALQLYAQDNDELLPPWRNRRHDKYGVSTIWDSPEHLYSSIHAKMKDPTVMYCSIDLYAGTDTEVFGVNHKRSSYYFNFTPPGSSDGKLTITGLMKGGSVAVPPADYPMVRDSNLDYEETVGGVRASGCMHLDTVNVIYVDLHADARHVRDGKILD